MHGKKLTLHLYLGDQNLPNNSSCLKIPIYRKLSETYVFCCWFKDIKSSIREKIFKFLTIRYIFKRHGVSSIFDVNKKITWSSNHEAKSGLLTMNMRKSFILHITHTHKHTNENNMGHDGYNKTMSYTPIQSINITHDFCKRFFYVQKWDVCHWLRHRSEYDTIMSYSLWSLFFIYHNTKLYIIYHYWECRICWNSNYSQKNWILCNFMNVARWI